MFDNSQLKFKFILDKKLLKVNIINLRVQTPSNSTKFDLHEQLYPDIWFPAQIWSSLHSSPNATHPSTTVCFYFSELTGFLS